jgi:hypothetical protein
MSEIWFVEDETREETIVFEGKEIKVKVKPLSWARKNQILSSCINISQDNGMAFNFDKYMKDTLCEIIVDAPWGKTNHLFLSRIKPELGSLLEKLVPKAFDGGKNSDFFGQE